MEKWALMLNHEGSIPIESPYKLEVSAVPSKKPRKRNRFKKVLLIKILINKARLVFDPVLISLVRHVTTYPL